MLVVGLIVGLAGGWIASQNYPAKETKAGTVDRSDLFIMATCPVDRASEAVFVLDIAGQLKGAWMNPRTGRFSNFYSYNVAGDFNLDPSVEPTYTMTTGTADLNNVGRGQIGDGIIYIAELTTGRVNAYMIQYNNNQNIPNQQAPLKLLDSFPWRTVLE